MAHLIELKIIDQEPNRESSGLGTPIGTHFSLDHLGRNVVESISDPTSPEPPRWNCLLRVGKDEFDFRIADPPAYAGLVADSILAGTQGSAPNNSVHVPDVDIFVKFECNQTGGASVTILFGGKAVETIPTTVTHLEACRAALLTLSAPHLSGQ